MHMNIAEVSFIPKESRRKRPLHLKGLVYEIKLCLWSSSITHIQKFPTKLSPIPRTATKENIYVPTRIWR